MGKAGLKSGNPNNNSGNFGVNISQIKADLEKLGLFSKGNGQELNENILKFILKLNSLYMPFQQQELNFFSYIQKISKFLNFFGNFRQKEFDQFLELFLTADQDLFMESYKGIFGEEENDNKTDNGLDIS